MHIFVRAGDVGSVWHLATVAVFVALFVDGGKADRRSPGGIRSPQHLALCVEAGADTAVAVGGAFLTGLAVLQEHVGGAVGRGTGAVLWEVTLPQGLPTHPST